MSSPKPPPPPVIIQQAAPPPPPTGASPAAQETTRQALGAELEFRPKFREEDVQDILKLGEATARLTREQAFPLAREERDLFKELEPETFQALQKTSQAVVDRLGAPLSPQMEEAYRERFRSEEALGGRLGSPVGSATIARQLAEVEEANKSQAISAGLSFLGRAPLSTPNVSAPSARQYGGFVAPQLGYTSDIYNTQSGIYGKQLGAVTDVYNAQAGIYRAQVQSRGSALGGLGQAAGTIAAKALFK